MQVSASSLVLLAKEIGLGFPGSVGKHTSSMGLAYSLLPTQFKGKWFVGLDLTIYTFH